MADQSNIQSAASKSIRPFKSSEEYLYAMKEDLAEWLNTLYELELTADTFLDGLATGCALCRHANNVNGAAQDFQREHPAAARSMKVPSKDVLFQSRGATAGSFVARDNVSNFIAWCRQELWIKDVLMFETNDLVERCNEKNFVLCLLEVARRGSKFGMLAPMLIQLEEEIEEEIRDQESQRMDDREEEKEEEEEKKGEAVDQSPPSRCFSRVENSRQSSEVAVEAEEDQPDPEPFMWQQKRVLLDMRNLDELVREILGQCSCPAQFPMIKVSEGKYKVGDSSALIFIRVLRTHVMVRVGGGWDTLEHYLDKHDPCRCSAFAHRYHQSKASGQGQGGQSKSSSAHSSRSTSPGPHWRNDGIAPYKPPERRSLEPSSTPGAPSSSSTRSGRSRNPSGSSELDSGTGRSLLPKPPRDRSEPRHFNPLNCRNKDTKLPLARRLSGDSDSSTASSKGGGGGEGRGGRYSVGGTPRRSGEEVVLMVNRKEGRHLIERPGAANRLVAPRARSQSRERSTLGPALRPNPPPQPPGSSPSRTERGRSSGTDGLRRLHGATPRSHSQGKLPSRTRSSDTISAAMSCREPQPPPSASGEEFRGRQMPPSPRVGGGVLAKRQSASCTSSPLKGLQNNNNHSSPSSKKIITTPRPPAPRSPSLGHRRILPPVTSGGRRSPHSTPRNSHHHPHHHHHATTSRAALQGPRSAGRPHARNCSSQENLQPQEGGESREGGGRGELGGLGFHMLPALDPQKEQDLYRSFEAEFLANTQQQGKGGGGGRGGGGRGGSTLVHNINNSTYTSSNTIPSSLKVGVLPDLRESRRASPCHLPLDDPLHLLYGSNSLGPKEQWMELRGGVGGGGGLRKLPAISSSTEETDPPSHLPLTGSDSLMNQVPQRAAGAAAVHCGNMNGGFSAEPRLVGQRGEEDLPMGEEEGLQPGSLYNLGNGDNNDGDSDELPPPETCPSPLLLRGSEEDCSFQDSSSSEENSSSMCFSLSESRSDSPQPSSPVANGDEHGDKGLSDTTTATSRADLVPHKHKPPNSKMIRPRMDNRPDNGPSRIPTPLSYRDRQGALSPCATPPASPQSSRSALGRRKTSCKILHQAFADLLGPQNRAPAVGSPDGPFPTRSASLDSDAWR